MARKRNSSGVSSTDKKKKSSRRRRSAGKAAPSAAAPPPALIVCIGASAGGLAPIQEILNHAPQGKGLAFVLIQHAGAEGHELLGSLLKQSTSLEVVKAVKGMPVLSDRIHIMPPGAMLVVAGGVLTAPPGDHCRPLRQPIDHFMCCLAVDQGARAVGVLLSGAGLDGTQGLTEIKAAGGTVIVQDPDTAEFPEMPRSAMSAVTVDAVLPPGQIPAKLAELAQGHLALSEERRSEQELAAVLRAVRAVTGHDFGGYKRATLVRRIARRMGLLQVNTYADYARHLRADANEARLLRRDLLIGVTEFFRQAEAWTVLENKVITPLVDHALPGSTLRVWAPACATGKEAYSLAILLAEAVQRSGKTLAIQVFATDADEKALEVARAGIFSREELAPISPARRQRFFTPKDGQYRVVKPLRELLVFAPQDLTADPPFSRLDLVSCRNLLIYLDHDLQRKIVAMFHFALREGGFLFLGSAETVNGKDELFETVSKKWRIYRRVGISPRKLEMPLRPTEPTKAPFAGVPLPPPRPTLTTIAQQAMLDHFAPAAVIIDRKGQLLYTHGAVEDFLRIHPGEQRGSIVDMAREGLRAHLRRLSAGLARSLRQVSAVARLKRGKRSVAVKITLWPLRYPREAEGLALVSFEEQRPSRPAAAPVEEGAPGEVERLEEELKTTKDELNSAISQLEQSNEHLKASNEEVTAANEELQAANEEMETSKEELQSLNEELNAVNLRLQEKVEELESTSNDILNLLSSTNIATLFLDRDLKIRRFTPALTQLFSLIGTDLDRPIADVRRLFEDPHLLGDAGKVLADLRPSGAEVQAEDGSWYLRRITPYRTQDDRIEGVVITFTDFSDRKAAERVREWHLDRMRVLLRGTQGVLAARDVEGVLSRIADTARELTGANLSTCGHGYISGQFRVGAASRAAGQPACPPGQEFCIAKGGAYLDLMQKADSLRLSDAQLRARSDWWGLPEGHVPLRGLMGARLVDVEGKPNGIIMVSDKADGGDFTGEDENLLRQLAAVASLALQHIEARELAEKSAQRAHWLARFPEENPDPVLRLDANGVLLYANPAAHRCACWKLDIGQPTEESLVAPALASLRENRSIEVEQVCGDRTYYIAFAPQPLGSFVNVYALDITARKDAEERVRRWTALLVAISRLQHETLSAPSVERLGQLCLNIAATLTGSQFGFIGEVGADGFLHDLAISETGWDVCTMYDKTGHRRPPGNFPIHGLYGRVVVDSKSLLVNEPANHPDSIGVPPGHPQLTSFLGVPFIREGKTVGMVAMANRPGGFRPEDQSALETLTPAIWDALTRKRVEQALHASNDSLQRSQEIAHLGSWELDLTTNRLTWSDEVYRIFGLTPQQFSATYEAFLERVHPEDRAAVDEAYSGSLRENRDSYEVEHRVVRADTGEIRVVHERCRHVRDTQGKIIRSLGMVQDITERKRAEAALVQSEQRYRTLFQTMTEGFSANEMICNENGTPCDLRYLAMNPAFERQTGLKAADVVGHTMLELFRHVEPVWIERYGKVALTGEPAHFEEWFGALGKWFEVHAFQTEPGRFGVVFADVTERKNTEDALRRAHDELEVRVAERTAELQRRAEQLAMLTSELTLAEQRERRRLAQVLHDHLQQLLVGAKFGLEVLARRVEEEQRPNVDQIRDLLDESIIASRSLTVELSPPILHEAGLAAGLEWLARWMKEKHGLDVELKLDPQVATDREDVKVLLFQSVRELLFNVVKHAHVTRATVEMRPSGPDTLRVEVSDAGVGFEPQEMWERSSHMAGGFGLISIRERLGMLGGTLEIVSSPQAGARFILTAPARAAAPATAIGAAAPAVSPGRPFAATPAAAPGQIRVMLADDHAVMRQGLAALLGEQDDIVVVGQAANGQEAVDLAGHLRPDIILMDYSMPVLDGLEATRRIHADWPEIRIIGLSMYEEADRAAAMLAAGAAAYLTKSGDPAQLLAQIRNRPGL